jgi:hypothetical protein
MSAIQSGPAAQGCGEGRATAASTRGWLCRFLDRIEKRRLDREREEMEAYLGEATDIADLEQRIRKWDRRLAPKSYGGLGF